MKHQNWREMIIRYGAVKTIALLSFLSMSASLAVTAMVHLAVGASVGPIALLVALAVPLFLTPPIGYVHISLILALHEAEARARKSAAADFLTGLSNRQAFAERAVSVLGLSARNGLETALIYLDLDHFKRINDTFGHGAGDKVLQQFADLLKSSLRRTDIIGRLGGEEFAVVLVKASANDASRLAEKIRRTVENTPFQTNDGIPISMTVSAGVASSGKEAEISLEDLITRADRSMYDAKESGRNCVRTYDPKRIGGAKLALGTAV